MTVKKGIIPAMLIMSALASAAEEQVIWSMSKEPDFRVPMTWEITPIAKEESAYTDVLRVIDEINREKGIKKQYLKDNGRSPMVTDNINIVPIFIDEAQDYGGTQWKQANKYYKPETLRKEIESGNKDIFNDFSFNWKQREMKYYFGDGNQVKDVIIQPKEKFDKNLEDLKKAKNDKYVIDGKYNNIDNLNIYNTLGVTRQEFEENFFDKDGNRKANNDATVLEFMRKKLTKKGYSIEIKNGDLWTKNGDDLHRVIWTMEPTSMKEVMQDNRVINFLRDNLKSQGINTIMKDAQLQIVKGEGENETLTPLVWNILPKNPALQNNKKMFDFMTSAEKFASESNIEVTKDGAFYVKDGVKSKLVTEGDTVKIVKADGSKEVYPFEYKYYDKPEDRAKRRKALIDAISNTSTELKNGQIVKIMRTEFGSSGDTYSSLKAIYGDSGFAIELDGEEIAVKIAEKDGLMDQPWYQNTLLNMINVFEKNPDGDTILYTEDGSIIVGNPLTVEDKRILIQGNSSWNQKELGSDTEGVNISETAMADYAKVAKGEMTEETFNNKWDSPDGTVANQLKPLVADYSKMMELKEKTDALEQEIRAKIKASDKYNYDDGDFFSSNTSWKEDVYKKYPEFKELFDAYDAMSPEFIALRDRLTGGEYGGGGEINALDIKRISNAKVVINRTGQRVEFRGTGRITGTVDLGEGEFNTLTVTEPFTGKYATNIVLAPTARLKNINYLYVGGQYNAGMGEVGLSGRNAFTIEVDPNKVNKDGNLYEHALQGTWVPGNKIVISAAQATIPEKADDFSIGVKTSTISKDSKIDIGRPIRYTAAWQKTGADTEYETHFYTDSIIHKLMVEDYGNADKGKNGILKVEIKDKLLRLSDDQNQVLKSAATSGHIGILSDTVSTINKKTQFSSTADEDKYEIQKFLTLLSDLSKQEDPEKILKEDAHIQVPEDKYDSFVKAIQDLEESPIVKALPKQVQNLKKYQALPLGEKEKEVLSGISSDEAILSLVKESDYNLEKFEIVSNNLRYKYGTDEALNTRFKELQKYAKAHFDKISEELDKIEVTETEEKVLVEGNVSLIDRIKGDLEKLKDPTYITQTKPEERLLMYLRAFKSLSSDIKLLSTLTENDILKNTQYIIEVKIPVDATEAIAWKQLVSNVFYTQRQWEALKELKTMINEVQDKNIYAKVNKISKERMNTFVPLAINTEFNGNRMARGGAVSGRYARDEFKGTIYTGYGLYETPINEKLSAGFIVGGGTSDHHEIVNDTTREKTTNSKIKGTAAFLGAYARLALPHNTEWISGVGLAHTKYDVDRNWKNNYQDLEYKGEVSTNTGNIYSGISYNYKINDSLDATVKGLLSYTLVNQGDASEEDKALALELDSKNYSYLDAQIGAGLVKTLYINDIKNSLSGTIYITEGLVGYDNSDLRGRFKGSNNSFDVKGESYEKQAVKLKLDYNAYYNSGFNFGLEGTYTKNSNENNISVGVKAGYSF